MVRGSYGLHYDFPQANHYRSVLTNDGQRQISIQIAGTAPGAPVYPNVPTSPAGFPTVRSSITVTDPNLSWMYVHQAQLGIERELRPDLGLSVTYAFTKGTKIPITQNINLAPPVGALADGRPIYSAARLDARFNNINMITAAANSNYNPRGLIDAARELDQVYVTSRYPNGFAAGSPADYFTDQTSQRLLDHARSILEFCRSQIR